MLGEYSTIKLFVWKLISWVVDIGFNVLLIYVSIEKQDEDSIPILIYVGVSV